MQSLEEKIMNKIDDAIVNLESAIGFLEDGMLEEAEEEKEYDGWNLEPQNMESFC